jgi:hypothetical protein
MNDDVVRTLQRGDTIPMELAKVKLDAQREQEVGVRDNKLRFSDWISRNKENPTTLRKAK